MTEGIKSLAVEKPPSGVCAYRHIHLNGLHCDILSSYVELNERALAPWRMPTIAEMRELEEKCTWGRYYLDGKRGCLVTGPNGKSIFLADAGTFKNGSLDDDTSGHYWSSTLSDYDLSGEGAMGWILHFNDSTYNAYTSSFRFYGLSVRPVAK